MHPEANGEAIVDFLIERLCNAKAMLLNTVFIFSFFKDKTNLSSISIIGVVSISPIIKTFVSIPLEIAIKILPRIAKVISRRMSGANSKVVNLASQYISGRTRSEHDLLGDKEVSAEVLYGIQTLRALENFNISGVNLSFYPSLIQALAMVKHAAAKANNELGLLSEDVTDAITLACEDIIHGKHHKEFVVDMIQGGAGTSGNDSPVYDGPCDDGTGTYRCGDGSADQEV